MISDELFTANQTSVSPRDILNFILTASKAII